MSFDRELFRFVEISDSKEHDIGRIEEPREGSVQKVDHYVDRDRENDHQGFQSR